MPNPYEGLIQPGVAKFVTQVGQLKHTAFDEFGDTTITSITTLNCLVYKETDEQRQTAPAVTASEKHFAIIGDTTTTILKGDQLASVVDRFGNAVLSDSRIVEIIDFDHWRYGRRFRQLRLDIDLDG